MSSAKKKFRKAKKSAGRALDEGRNAAEYALEAGQEVIVDAVESRYDAVESRYDDARRSVLGTFDDTTASLRRRPVAALCTAWSSGVVLGLLLGMRAAHQVSR